MSTLVRSRGRLLGAVSLLILGLATASAGPLALPAAAAQPDQAAHGLGSNPSPGLTRGISAAASQLAGSMTLPVSADLSQWDPPVGDQGSVNSCASWATGYYYRYWLRNHAVRQTSTFAPMFLYSQIVANYNGGADSGSSFWENFNILQSQGIPHAADYSHSDYDYADQPTAADKAAAARYLTTSSTELYYYGTGTENQTAIEASIAGGKPVVMRIPVYDDFWNANLSSYMVNVPGPSPHFHGWHAVFAPKYDAAGVWIENSWGTYWGDEGWAELSWDFVNQYSTEGWSAAAADSAAPTRLSVSTANPYVAGAAHSVTVTARDAYGNVAAGYRGTVHLTSSDPAAVLPADYTFSAVDSGVHRFSTGFTLKTAGSRSVTATDRSTASITGSQTVTVTPGAARTLAVVTAGAWVAGGSHSVTITARDAYGNVATGYLGSIHLTSSDPAAVLPTDYTFVSADAGIHKLTVKLRTAGSRSLTATDKTTASIKGSQGGIVVTAAAAKTFTVAGPTPWAHGAAHSVTITARDAYGNVATGYTGTVHLASSDPAAVLPADYKFIAADAGIHNLTVTLKTGGSRWIRATDTVTATITGSQTITVS